MRIAWMRLPNLPAKVPLFASCAGFREAPLRKQGG